MALKHARTIIVRDQKFQWVLTHGRMGTVQRNMTSFEAPLFAEIIVHAAALPGKMRAKIVSDIWDDAKHLEEFRWGGKLHKASVTPADVRLVIEKALDDGWDPTNRGQHELAGPLKLAEYSMIGG